MRRYCSVGNPAVGMTRQYNYLYRVISPKYKVRSSRS